MYLPREENGQSGMDGYGISKGPYWKQFHYGPQHSFFWLRVQPQDVVLNVFILSYKNKEKVPPRLCIVHPKT
jgi:hypothetical protein